jgi:hypothetical protein
MPINSGVRPKKILEGDTGIDFESKGERKGSSNIMAVTERTWHAREETLSILHGIGKDLELRALTTFAYLRYFASELFWFGCLLQFVCRECLELCCPGLTRSHVPVNTMTLMWES